MMSPNLRYGGGGASKGLVSLYFDRWRHYESREGERPINARLKNMQEKFRPAT